MRIAEAHPNTYVSTAPILRTHFVELDMREPPFNVSSLPIMEKGEQFLKVIEIFALLCSHYKMSL